MRYSATKGAVPACTFPTKTAATRWSKEIDVYGQSPLVGDEALAAVIGPDGDQSPRAQP